MSTLKVDTYLTRGGASEIAIDKLKGVTAAGSMLVVGEGGTTTTNLQQGLCKAWFVFDQINSNTIDDSLNIGSITDRATGCMYGNFTNNMNSLHYTSVGITSPVASGSMGTDNSNRSVVASADTTARSSMNAYKTDTVATFFDLQSQQQIIHGDLA